PTGVRCSGTTTSSPGFPTVRMPWLAPAPARSRPHASLRRSGVSSGIRRSTSRWCVRGLRTAEWTPRTPSASWWPSPEPPPSSKRHGDRSPYGSPSSSEQGARWRLPRRASEDGQHPVALENRDLGAVLLPLRPLVAQEDVEDVLAQRL